MISIITGYLKHRIKGTISIIVSVLCFSLLIMSCNTLIHETNQDELSNLLDIAGEHDICCFNLSSEQVDQLSKDNRISKTGYFYNCGLYILSDNISTFTLGHFDNNGLSMGHIELMEGLFPEKPEEICMEDHIRYASSPIMKIGDNISLTKNGVTENFVISGFIKDYQANWNLIDDYEKGISDFPSIIVSYEYSLSNAISINALINVQGMDQRGNTGLIASEMCDDLGIDDVVFNDNKGSIYQNVLFKPVKMYSLYFTLIYSVIGLVMLNYLYSLFLTDLYKDFDILRSIGADKSFLLKTLITVILIPYIIGLALGIIVYTALFSSVLNGKYIGLISGEIIRSIIYPLIIIVLIVLIKSLQTVFRKRKRGSDRQNRFTEQYTYELIKINIRSKYKRIFLIIMTILFFVISVSCIHYDESIREREFISSYYGIYANASSGYMLQYMGPYCVTSYNSTYKYKDLELLTEKLKGTDVKLSYEYEDNFTLLIPEDHCVYWDILIQSSPSDFHLLPYCISENQKGISTIPAVTLKSDNIDEYRNRYPSVDFEEDLKKGNVVLILPPILKNNENISDFTTVDPKVLIYEETFNEGDTITISRLKPVGSFKELQEDPNKVVYCEDKLKISKIIRIPADVIDIDGQMYKDYTPKILWNEETANSLNVVDGIARFSAIIPKDISEDKYSMYRTLILHTAMASNNSYIYEDKVFSDFYSDLFQKVNANLYIIGGMFIIALLVLLVSVLYISINSLQKNYAILLTLGIGAKDIKNIIMIEYMFYWLSGVIMILPMEIILLKTYSWKILTVRLTVDGLIPYLISVFVLALIIISILIIIKNMYCKKLYKSNIAELIRYSE